MSEHRNDSLSSVSRRKITYVAAGVGENKFVYMYGYLNIFWYQPIHVCECAHHFMCCQNTTFSLKEYFLEIYHYRTHHSSK